MKRTNSLRSTLETLESREVPANTVNVTLRNGLLLIDGNSDNNTIVVRQSGSTTYVNDYQTQSAVNRLYIRGHGGHDTINVKRVNVPTTVLGGTGADYIVGSDGGDYLSGGTGNDTLFGQAGNDTIYGGANRDRLFGDSGYDYLYGGSGTDFLDDGNRSSSEYLASGSGADFFADTWVVGGCQVTDIDQRGLPTCSFLASLSAGSDAGINYGSWIAYTGYTSSGMPIYSVSLWHPTQGFFTQSIGFDGDVNGYDTGTAQNSNRVAEFETWVLLLQRAYLNYVGGNGSSRPDVALPAAIGGRVTHYNTTDTNAKTALVNAMNADRPVVCSILSNTLYGINKHAMTVVAARGTFDNLEVRIYNPWGSDGKTTSGKYVAVDGKNDGYFWVSWSTFKAYMDGGFYVG